MFEEYLQFIASRRCSQIGLPDGIPAPRIPFPWMSGGVGFAEGKNFSKTRVTEYQTGGALNWD